ncbi:MAG TPA: hypothetical protein VL360_08420 [Gammaproteobacteria bacterium]|nr:hypothetical protein [Gammaproteobacteria bacterium]
MINSRAAHFFSHPTSLSINNETALHQFIRKCKKSADLHRFISLTGDAGIVKMAKTCDNNGTLPIDLIVSNSCTFPDNLKNELIRILIPYTIRNQFIPLQQLLDADMICTPYINQSRLHQNLMYACAAVNKVRSIIKDSKTHPASNSYSIDRKFDLMIKTDVLRMCMYDANQCTFDNYMQQPVEMRKLILESNARLIEYAEIGNCSEYSFLCLHIMLDLEPNLNAEIFEVVDGDHIVLVLDRNQESNENDYTTWGNDAVVCDAWSGKVYPAYQINENMNVFSSRVFIQDDDRYDVVTNFNKHYHTMKPLFSLAKDFHLTPRRTITH